MLTREIKSGINYNKTNDTVIGIGNISLEFRKYLMITINDIYGNLDVFYWDLVNNLSNHLFYLKNYNTLLIHALHFILFDFSFHCYDKYLHQSIEFASVGNDYFKNDNGDTEYDDNDEKSKEKIHKKKMQQLYLFYRKANMFALWYSMNVMKKYQLKLYFKKKLKDTKNKT